MLDLVRGQRRGRLVEQNHPAAAQQRLGAFDLLLLRDRQAAAQRADIDVQAERVERRARPRPHRPPVDPLDQPGRGRQLADEHRLRDGQFRHQGRLLRHQIDPARMRLVRRGERDRVPVDRERAAVRTHQSRHHLEQGGLPGAVLAHHGMHAAGIERDVDAAQHRDRTIILGDATGAIDAAASFVRYGLGHPAMLLNIPCLTGSLSCASREGCARSALGRTLDVRSW